MKHDGTVSPFLRNGFLSVVLVVAASHPLAAQAVRDDSAAAHFTVGSAQSMLGVAGFGFADLNARLAAAGLPKVANTAATIGLDADVRAGRFLFGAGFQSMLSRTQADIAYRTRMYGDYSLFDAGYALVNTTRTTIYPMVGIGVAHLAVNVKERGDFAFDDGLHSPAREVSMSATSGLAHTSVMIERRFRRASGTEFALTIRVGMMRSLTTLAWRSDESQVRDGPDGLRGSYLRIGFSRPLARRSGAALPIAGTVLQSLLR